MDLRVGFLGRDEVVGLDEYEPVAVEGGWYAECGCGGQGGAYWGEGGVLLVHEGYGELAELVADALGVDGAVFDEEGAVCSEFAYFFLHLGVAHAEAEELVEAFHHEGGV